MTQHASLHTHEVGGSSPLSPTICQQAGEFSVLFHKYHDNGMFRFEAIPKNNERGVPFVVRKRRERKKLTKDEIPFGLRLFFCLLRCSSLTYRCGYAALTAPLMLNKNSISHCYRIYESEHSYCFTILNSPLRTFTPGQSNACSVRHVPYLDGG